MARLVGHLARQAAQVAHVAQRDHGAGDVALVVAHRRDGELDRALAVAVGRDQHAATAEVDARAGRERLAHRVAERLAVRLVDEVHDFAERVADRVRHRLAEQRLAGAVHVDDAAVDVGRQHALGQRIERRPRRGSRAAAVPLLGARADLDRRHEQRRLRVVADAGEIELDARRVARHRPQLDFEPHGRGLAFAVASQVLAEQLRRNRDARDRRGAGRRAAPGSSHRRAPRIARWRRGCRRARPRSPRASIRPVAAAPLRDPSRVVCSRCRRSIMRSTLSASSVASSPAASGPKRMSRSPSRAAIATRSPTWRSSCSWRLRQYSTAPSSATSAPNPTRTAISMSL